MTQSEADVKIIYLLEQILDRLDSLPSFIDGKLDEVRETIRLS